MFKELTLPIFKGPTDCVFVRRFCSNKNDANLKCVPGKPSFLLANKNEENYQVYPDSVRRTCSTSSTDNSSKSEVCAVNGFKKRRFLQWCSTK
jgi:hypothetical protein